MKGIRDKYFERIKLRKKKKEKNTFNLLLIASKNKKVKEEFLPNITSNCLIIFGMKNLIR